MSFAGRAPFGMPPFAMQAVRPGMRAQFGTAFTAGAPVGLLPTPGGTTILGQAPVTVISKSSVPSTQAQQSKTESKVDVPKTTAFVGNISERAPDVLVRQLLGKCGTVLNWKRVQGASGNLQAFGFCEYKEPENTLRAIRLLHDLTLGDKNLLVKVDAKTRELLDNYLEEKKKASGLEGSNDDLDDATKMEDSRIKDELNKLIVDYRPVLSKPTDASEPEKWGSSLSRFKNPKAEQKKEEEKEQIATRLLRKPREQRDDKIDDLEMEDDKKQIISREIDRFRTTHKDETDKENDDRRGSRERSRDRDRERERERERRKERERRDREREKEREERDKKERERERERVRRERERERERQDEERERESRRERDRERERERDRDRLEEEEEHERRKLERKLREKEEAYQERLKNWESRERKKGREYDKIREKEKNDKIEMEKDRRSLRDFLEDYDDDKQDIKYYKGAAFEKRREDREKEIEADIRDRRRENDEIQEIKQRLKEEGVDNLEEEYQRLDQEREGHKQRRLDDVDLTKLLSAAKEQPKESEVHEIEDDNDDEEAGEVQDDDDEDEEEEDEEREEDVRERDRRPSPQPQANLKPAFQEVQQPRYESRNHVSPPPEEPEPEPKPKMGFGGLKLGASSSPQSSNKSRSHSKKKKLTVQQVFNQDDDDAADDVGPSKKRKLVPIEYSEEEMKAVSQSQAKKQGTNAAEEKRRSIKSLIEKIPTEKAELFAYQIDWNMVEESLMERRIRPWINKKIVEYIGEEEPTLTDFICTKLLDHSSAESILSDITMVLDEEAEVFVVKMWRLLIYEVEAKKHGLVK